MKTQRDGSYQSLSTEFRVKECRNVCCFVIIQLELYLKCPPNLTLCPLCVFHDAWKRVGVTFSTSKPATGYIIKRSKVYACLNGTRLFVYSTLKHEASLNYTYTYIYEGKGKGTVHPGTGHEGPEGE